MLASGVTSIRGVFDWRLPSLGIGVVLSLLALELAYFGKFGVDVLDFLVIYISDIIFTLPFLLY